MQCDGTYDLKTKRALSPGQETLKKLPLNHLSHSVISKEKKTLSHSDHTGKRGRYSPSRPEKHTTSRDSDHR